jgi:hypothetical protein
VYAGAMLLHPFLAKVGAGEVLSALDSGPARSYHGEPQISPGYAAA